MFVVHFHVRSTDPGGFDEMIRTLVWRLVETKSHGTFALLFGAGFAIQLRRSEERRERFAGRYLRRLAVLAAFGFIAHACFGYNVLLGYALWGVPLLIMRTWSTRTLLAIAALSAASLPVYYLVAPWVVQLSAEPDAVAAIQQAQQALAAQVNDAVNVAEAQTSYAALFAGIGIGLREGALGGFALALGAAGSAAALLSMFANLGIDREQGGDETGDAVGYPGLAGFELDLRPGNRDAVRCALRRSRQPPLQLLEQLG